MSVMNEVDRKRVVTLIADVLEVDPEELTPTSSFRDDHGADSLQAIEVLGILEREFKIKINQSELRRMVNLQEVCDVVAEALGKKDE